MLGVFLDRDTLDRGDMDFSPLDAALPDWQLYSVTHEEDLIERIKKATVVVSNKVVLGEKAFAAAPDLKLVCVAATGYNNIDLKAARKHGITISNVRAYATPSVSQHVFGLILSLSIHLNNYRDAVNKGEWQQSPHFSLLDYPIRELAGKKLGIVGYGELGHAVANIAKAFGMEVLLARRPTKDNTVDTRPDRFPLETLLPQVDVLTLHCPLTEETQGLIGAKEIALMKEDALLINTARGGIVDEYALVEALKDGHLGGAGIDVLTIEPPINGNPLLNEEIPNLIVTPHIAWASQESRQRLVNEIGKNIEMFLDGNPHNVVK